MEINVKEKYINALKILILFVFSITQVYADNSLEKSNSGRTLDEAIGYLVLYQSERKANLKHGVNSPFKEVVKVYFNDIEKLTVKERVRFLFNIDLHLAVRGGEDFWKFYNLIYLCCNKEYALFLEENIMSPYLDSEYLKFKYLRTTGNEDRAKSNAKMRKMSLEEYKIFLRNELIEWSKMENKHEENL